MGSVVLNNALRIHKNREYQRSLKLHFLETGRVETVATRVSVHFAELLENSLEMLNLLRDVAELRKDQSLPHDVRQLGIEADDGEMERYSTVEEARNGHRRAVELARANAADAPHVVASVSPPKP